MGMRGFFLEHLHAEAPNLILWFVVLGYHVLIALTHVHTHIPALLLSKNDWLLLSVSFSLPLSVDYTYYGMSGKSAGNVIIRLALALGPLEPRRCHERGTLGVIRRFKPERCIQIFGKSTEGLARLEVTQQNG